MRAACACPSWSGCKLPQVSHDMGVVRVMGKGAKERLVPLGEEALAWIRRYLREARPALLDGRASEDLFVTARGCGMTRQMFWRLIKRLRRAGGDRARRSLRTPCAMPSRRTCSITVPICAWCNCCSDMQTYRPRRSIPTSRASG